MSKNILVGDDTILTKGWAPSVSLSSVIVPLFTATLFISALLLFLAQPMVAKMVLPILGGAPMVWNACMVFFQLALLAGYGYAHCSTRYLGPRAQMIGHALLLVLPFAVLPVVIQRESVSVVQNHQALGLMVLLAGTIGLPFLVLSTSASVLQHWFSRTDHPSASDPYFLYAASNLGSFVALAAYPTIVEPLLSLRDQSRSWTAAYGLFVALVFVCAVVTWRHATGSAERSAEETRVSVAPAIGPRRRARWVALAFIPSSLMLAVTTYLSTDVAAIPLFWVLPLGLYLATFIAAFSSNGERARRVGARFFPVIVLPVILLLGARAWSSLILVLPLHLLSFVAASLMCHGELAADRPDRSYLTEFYLWISFGGVLGGIFNSLVSPLIFKSVAEYPIALVMACFFLPAMTAARSRHSATSRLVDVALPAATFLLAMAVVLKLGRPDQIHMLVVLLAIPAILAFSQRANRVRFASTLGALLLAALWFGNTGETLLHAERTFFGVYRVNVDADHRYHELMHGTTMHGRELTGAGRGEPLTYFHRTGPFGQAWSALPRAASASQVAVTGLGVGTLAAYAGPAQHWTFFEIDPAVERIARDVSYFTFLDRCGDRCHVVIGDARLSLERAADHGYDVMVLDAFSSDAVPMHLLTREAFSLYVSKLAAGGAIMVNISNRHLTLDPIVARLAESENLVAFLNVDRERPDWPAGRAESKWVAMARQPEDLGRIVGDPRWVRLRAPAGRVWTDDFSNILSAIALR